jgi:hypothetical protein
MVTRGVSAWSNGENTHGGQRGYSALILLQLLCAAAACPSKSRSPATNHRTSEAQMSAPDTASSPDEAELSLQLSMDPRPVLRGFPMLVAATVHNGTRDSVFSNLPLLGGWMSGPTASELQLSGPDGFSKKLQTRDPSALGDAEGFALRPGEQRRFLLDLANSVLDPPAGMYTLRIDVQPGEHAPPLAASTRFELVEPNPEDWAVRQAWFRSTSPRPLGNWEEFLTRGWLTPSEPLSPAAERATAFHRFEHRVVYGPEPLALHDAGPLLGLEDHVAYPEFQLFHHELLLARGETSQAERVAEKIIERWPGLAPAVKDNERGRGRLTSARKAFGAESHRAKAPDGSLPYRPAR